jgi:hypothetical protein
VIFATPAVSGLGGIGHNAEGEQMVLAREALSCSDGCVEGIDIGYVMVARLHENKPSGSRETALRAATATTGVVFLPIGYRK